MIAHIHKAKDHVPGKALSGKEVRGRIFCVKMPTMHIYQDYRTYITGSRIYITIYSTYMYITRLENTISNLGLIKVVRSV